MRKILLVSAFVAVGSLASGSAFANSISNGGRLALVKIIEALNLSVTTDLNFGAVQRPASGSVTVTVGSDGTVGGSATRFDALITQTAGVYNLTGDDTNGVLINITALANSTGMTLTAFDQKYNGASFTNGDPLAAPGTAGKPLLIGATLNIPSTVTTGSHSLGYDINVEYQ